MRKILFAAVLSLVFSLAVARPSHAAPYPTSPYDQTTPYTIGGCVMVDTEAEKDATHVYTLAPDVLWHLNSSYRELWGRSARCDELQFHAYHATSRERLRPWLSSVTNGWFKNIGTTHFRNQTVSTSRHEFFFISGVDGKAHRIPDWLTTLSHGFLIKDRLSIAPALTDSFYNFVSFGAPVNFNDGTYRDEILAIWQDGERDYSDLPGRLADEIEFMVGNEDENDPSNTTREIFVDCSFFYRFPGDPWGNLFDFSWMQSNPGCPNA